MAGVWTRLTGNAETGVTVAVVVVVGAIACTMGALALAAKVGDADGAAIGKSGMVGASGLAMVGAMPTGISSGDALACDAGDAFAWVFACPPPSMPAGVDGITVIGSSSTFAAPLVGALV